MTTLVKETVATATTVIDPLRTVDNSVYTKDAFELEQEHIFRKLWNFVCHESEIRNPGDFITKEIVGEPILVARDDSGALRAYYNVCRHRGSLVIPQERGHCRAFRCPYHWWTYSLEGQLTGVPGVEAYDGTGFRKEDWGLVPLRVESLLGLVFVSLDPDAETLEEFLERDFIDIIRTPLGMAEYEVIYFERHNLNANWKCFAENSRDGYHVPFVHPALRKASPPKDYVILPNGHAVQRLGMDPAGMEPEIWEDVRKFTLPGVEMGNGYIAVVFPDHVITLYSNVIGIEGQIPINENECFFESRVLGLASDTEEMRAVRKRSWDFWFSTPLVQEDEPVLRGQHRGLKSRGVTVSLIARGQDSLTGIRGDDNRLRQFWARWRELMGTEGNSIRDGAGSIK